MLLESPGFVRASVRSGEQSVTIDWATDTAFRFIPILADDELGYRLQENDAAVLRHLKVSIPHGRSALKR